MSASATSTKAKPKKPTEPTFWQRHSPHGECPFSMVGAMLVHVGPFVILGVLAYFGISSTNVNPNLSIFDLRRYGVAYLVVWIPFIVLAVAALLLRWRIQPRTQGWGRRNQSLLRKKLGAGRWSGRRSDDD